MSVGTYHRHVCTRTCCDVMCMFEGHLQGALPLGLHPGSVQVVQTSVMSQFQELFGIVVGIGAALLC